MPPKDVTDVIEWAQAYRRKVPPMLLNGPSIFLSILTNGIEWAQTCCQNPLRMLLDGPSIFLGSPANYFEWAQCYPGTFCQ